jgi:mercuric ion binding protein
MRFLLIVLISTILFAKEVTVVLKVEGMTCPLCTTAVKKSLKKTDGVIKAKVRLNTKRATVIYDDKKCDTKSLLEATKRVGYKSTVIKIK